MVGQHVHTITGQRNTGQIGHLGVLTQQDAWCHLDLSHLGAQAGKTLRQLAANRAAAQHHQPCWGRIQFGELTPQRVAGDIPYVFQARQRWHQRPRTRSDDDGAGGQALHFSGVERDLHRPGVNDSGIALQHFHTQGGIAFHAVVRGHSGNYFVHAGHHLAKTELGFCRTQAIVFSVAHLVGHAGRLDKCLARHATVVQTVAPHLVRFHQSNFGFHGCRNIGGDQARRAAANHHQIAVKLVRALPFGVNAAALQKLQKILGQHGEHPKQPKRQQHAG